MQLKLVYFSPTGTTQKVLEGIAEGFMAGSVEHINVTLPESAEQAVELARDELVILGAPVYGGRLPIDAVKRIERIKADGTPVILVVVYGNREFEDALLELKNLAMELGLRPVAAAAFIGEHSFATAEIPIANGRPDAMDIQKAKDFGRKIKDTISALQPSAGHVDLDVPGTLPYEAKGTRSMSVSPETREETCSLCGTCASLCPTAAISISETVVTKVELCIRCCACIKKCPTGVRLMEDSSWKKIAGWLTENCSIRKEPQFFGVER